MDARLDGYYGVGGVTTKSCPLGKYTKCLSKYKGSCMYFAKYDGPERMNMRGFGKVVITYLFNENLVEITNGQLAKQR